MRLLKALFVITSLFQGTVHAQELYLRPAFKFGTLTAPGYQYTLSFPQWGGGTLEQSFEMNSSISLSVSLGVSLDLHLISMNDDMSLGLQSSPTLGLYIPTNDRYYDDMGVPLLRSVPLYAQFNYGVFSTKNSIKERGLGIGVGMHYLAINNRNISDNSTITSPLSWMMPSARLSYRFWNFLDVLQTVNITYSRSGVSDIGLGRDFRQQYIDISLNFQLKY